jgi:hypothetical protein
MPPSDSQTFCSDLVVRSGDTPVAGASMTIPSLGLNAHSSPSNSFAVFLCELRAFAVKISSNPNFAWVLQMLQHLATNGSMSSNFSGEGDIRRAVIEADLVETAMRECAPLKPEGTPQVLSEARDNMVALLGKLLTNTQLQIAA